MRSSWIVWTILLAYNIFKAFYPGSRVHTLCAICALILNLVHLLTRAYIYRRFGVPANGQLLDVNAKEDAHINLNALASGTWLLSGLVLILGLLIGIVIGLIS